MPRQTRSQRPKASQSQAPRATQAGSSRRPRIEEEDEDEHIAIDGSDDGDGEDDKAMGVSFLLCRACVTPRAPFSVVAGT